MNNDFVIDVFTNTVALWNLKSRGVTCWQAANAVEMCLYFPLLMVGGSYSSVGMFGMRKFRYWYTGKKIPVIPVYRYFGLVKSWVFLDLQNHEMDEKSQNI